MEINTVVFTESGSYIVNKNVDENDDRQITIPNDMANSHCVMVQEWIDAGNVPDPYVGPTDIELCMEEILRLESTVTPRRMRDAVASVEGKTWLADIESKIAIERVKLNG